MEQRVKPLRAASFGVLAVALLVCGPWVGWCTLIPLTVASLMFVLTDRGLQTSARPEYRLAVAWLSAELAIAVSVALTGGPRSPAVSWLVLPVVTLAARFSVRRVIAGSSVAAALILASSLGVAPAEVIAQPQQVVFRLEQPAQTPARDDPRPASGRPLGHDVLRRQRQPPQLVRLRARLRSRRPSPLRSQSRRAQLLTRRERHRPGRANPRQPVA